MKKALPMFDYNWHVAEDAVQQTFLRLWKTTSFDPNKSKPSTYAVWQLRGVVSRMKAVWLRDLTMKRQLKTASPGFTADFGEHEQIREAVEEVRATISHLPAYLKPSINRFERGETLREVAKATGITFQGVQHRERMAAQRIREMLDAS